MRDSLISFEDIEEKSKCSECLKCMIPVCFQTFIISCLVSFTLYSYFSDNEDGSNN